MVLNFRSIAHQRKFFNDQCVKNGDVRTSCCYAMATDVPTKRSSGSCTARASVALRPAHLSIRKHLPIFAEAIPCKGTESDRDLLGSGSPICRIN